MADKYLHYYEGYGVTMLEAAQKCIEQVAECNDIWTDSAETYNE